MSGIKDRAASGADNHYTVAAMRQLHQSGEQQAIHTTVSCGYHLRMSWYGVLRSQCLNKSQRCPPAFRLSFINRFDKRVLNDISEGGLVFFLSSTPFILILESEWRSP